VLDTHANKAFCYGNGVFRNELLERNEEARLDSDSARDGGVTVDG
jgi:hypothetical protein